MSRQTSHIFGHMPDGRAVQAHRLVNANGMRATILDYGAILQELRLPDGRNVVLGFDDLPDYLSDEFYIGAVIGRYAGRIKDGRFTIGGETFDVGVNEGKCHLHGGQPGFHRKLWRAEPLSNNSIRLHLHSPDGEGGYPGNLDVSVTYTLTDQNVLRLKYRAQADRDTPINLTHHAYFNLSGGAANILDHELQVQSDQVLETNKDGIPSGKFIPLKNHKLDFQQPRRIGSVDLDGIDNSFVLSESSGLNPASQLTYKDCALSVKTTEPSLHIYNGAHLSGKFAKYAGICLETQHFPDSPNKPDFPTTILKAGDVFESATEFHFTMT